MNYKSNDAFATLKSILLVEDDVDDQDFITEAFRTIDPQLTIHIVSNGNRVLPFLQAFPEAELPQLIVLDYNLPELDGGEVLQVLTADERYRLIPKIVWSTSNAPRYKARALELGASGYMVKPSNITGIENMAREMLEFCQTSA
jgi:CheY-like chemotaxis protein